MITLLVVIFLVIVFQIESLGEFLNQIFGPLFSKLFFNLQSILIFSGVTILTIVVIVFLMIKLKALIKKLPFYQKLSEFISGLLDGVKTIMKLRQKWLFLFYTFIIWLFYAIMVYLPVFMLEETSNLTFLNALTILAIGSLGIVAPVPGGIGAYHFIVKAVLHELFNISGNVAGSFAAITHAGQTLLNVIIGSMSYFYLGFLAKKEKPLNE